MLGPGGMPQQPPLEAPPPPWGVPAGGGGVDMMMGNNNEDDFFVDNPTWRERERRQRSIRLLMMFLLMLLLMDNEEQAGRNNGNLNGNLRNRSKNKKGMILEPQVYERRQRQEESLREITQHHERYKNLMDKNSGENIQQEVVKWAEDHLAMQKDEFFISEHNLDNSDGGSGKQQRAVDEAAVVAAVNAAAEKDPMDYSKVFHYPWNTTGFYRGEWHRLDNGGKSTAAAKDEASDAATVSVVDAVPTTTTTKSSTTESVENNIMEYVDAVALEEEMLNILKEKKHHKAGVFLLPPGKEVIMRDDNNLTSTKFDLLQEPSVGMRATTTTSTTRHSQKNGGPPTSYLRGAAALGDNNNDDTYYYSYGTGVTPTTNHFDATFTKTSGRAAFQLFTRAIPSMKEISLIDGFIKLYDSNMPGYSSRKDILMRVRGVLIHAIGRISLVSNVAPARTVLVLPPQGDDYYNMKTTKRASDDDSDINASTTKKKTTKKKKKTTTKKTTTTTNDNTLLGEDEEENEGTSIRRRRLQENLNKDFSALSSPSSVSSETSSSSSELLLKATMEQIRDDALELFPGVDPTQYVDKMKLEGSNNNNGQTDSFITEIPLHVILEQEEEYVTKKNTQRRTTEVEEVVQAEEKEGPEEAQEEEKEDGDDSNNQVSIDEPRIQQQQLSQKQDERRTMETRVEEEEEEDSDNNDKFFSWSDIVFPYPYVQDDEDETIRKTRTPAARKMPPREQLLERNAGQCEFEVNMDVQEVEWTIGEWKKLMGRKVHEQMKLNPATLRDAGEMEEEDSGQNSDGKNKNDNSKEGGRSSKIRSSNTKLKIVQDQALAMTLVGIIHSPNCQFTATLNVTALRTDWENTTGKAINYSFYMMLTCLIQIMVLLRQLLHTQAQSAAIRVSLLCIGWQTVLDALLCLGHIYLSLAMQPLFTAFASVAFFKLLIFCVIEMKYMALIIQARNNNNGGNTTELLRRQVAMLHLRFYVALFGSFLAFFYAGEQYRCVYILALYSFWVPQIIQNIITEAKKPLHNYYIYGMSVTRLIAPLYIFGIKYNFLKEVYPESPTDIFMCEMLILWVMIQTAILIAQGKYGTRFMIPARFLPPKFDYSRPIPPSLLPPGLIQQQEQQQQQQQGQQSSQRMSKSRSKHHNSSSSISPTPTDTTSIIVDETQRSTDRHTTGVTTRNRIKKGSRRHKMKSETMTAEPIVSHRNDTMVDVDLDGNNDDDINNNTNTPTLDCVICYNAIDVNNRRGYMLAPCDHIFHKDCLIQWMEIKMECPVCRTDLPSL